MGNLVLKNKKLQTLNVSKFRVFMNLGTRS
jgi:hypothetical protein